MSRLAMAVLTTISLSATNAHARTTNDVSGALPMLTSSACVAGGTYSSATTLKPSDAGGAAGSCMANGTTNRFTTTIGCDGAGCLSIEDWTVTQSATLRLLAGTVSDGTNVTDSGIEEVYGTSHGARIIDGGRQIVRDGGISNGASFKDMGEQSLSGRDGAIAISNRATFTDSASQVIDAYGQSNDASFADDTAQIIADNGVANDSRFSGDAAQTLQGGGSANNSSFFDRATQTLETGALASNNTFFDSSVQTIAGGEADHNFFVADTRQIIQAGGVANHSELWDRAASTIENGGTAIDTIVHDGVQTVEAGGMARDTTIHGGSQWLAAGGTADSTYLDGGMQRVLAGATANGTTVTQSGVQQVDAGAVVNSAQARDGGHVIAMDDGVNINGLLMDEGVLVFGAHTAADASFVAQHVTVNQLQGSGTIRMTTDLGDDLADHLQVNRGSGAFDLDIRDVSTRAASGDPDYRKYIVHTTGGTPAFSLQGGGVDVGAYVYGLHKDEQDDWYLSPNATQAPDGTEIPIYNNTAEDAQELAQASQGTASAQTRQVFARLDYLVSGRGFGRENRLSDGLWVHTDVARERLSPVSAQHIPLPSTTATSYGIQLGGDRLNRYDNGNWIIGLTTGANWANYRFSDTSTGHSKTWNAGFYTAWLADAGWYAELTGRYLHGSQQLKTITASDEPTAARYGAKGYTSSAQIGRRMSLEDNWTIEPQLQLSALHQSGAAYATSYGTHVRVAAQDPLWSRLGAQIDKRIERDGPHGYSQLDVYTRLGWIDQIRGTANVTVDGTPLSSSIKGHRAAFALGADWMRNALHVYAEASTEQGSRYARPRAFMMGVRKTW